ncbi:hypothetical protein NDU88_002686 [Pleurodeles waltl]|uniref:Uncharacterized protein n=1 Tax=Pleurodeles waltl TaxID=8319 RepID=A0AAV7WQ79_PLEWA|nr:hypothetical protein NDU88_002686 [Pleurodeles waltl]
MFLARAEPEYRGYVARLPARKECGRQTYVVKTCRIRSIHTGQKDSRFCRRSKLWTYPLERCPEQPSGSGTVRVITGRRVTGRALFPDDELITEVSALVALLLDSGGLEARAQRLFDCHRYINVITGDNQAFLNVPFHLPHLDRSLPSSPEIGLKDVALLLGRANEDNGDELVPSASASAPFEVPETNFFIVFTTASWQSPASPMIVLSGRTRG